MGSKSVFKLPLLFLFTACGLDEGGQCLFAAETGCTPFTSDSGDSDAGPDDATAEGGQDMDATDGADSSNTDSATDALVDAPAETGADAEAGVDAGICGSSGTVVFDSSMPCYKEGIYRAGNFLPPPDSSPNTATCQTGTCGNSPMSGDFEALWVQETQNTGKFTSTTAPSIFTARCTVYTAASPPDMSQLKSEMVKATGWFTPTVMTVATSYTLTAPSCAGSSVLYVMKY
jgi:hypothetical protein